MKRNSSSFQDAIQPKLVVATEYAHRSGFMRKGANKAATVERKLQKAETKAAKKGWQKVISLWRKLDHKTLMQEKLQQIENVSSDNTGEIFLPEADSDAAPHPTAWIKNNAKSTERIHVEKSELLPKRTTIVANSHRISRKKLVEKPSGASQDPTGLRRTQFHWKPDNDVAQSFYEWATQEINAKRGRGEHDDHITPPQNGSDPMRFGPFADDALEYSVEFPEITEEEPDIFLESQPDTHVYDPARFAPAGMFGDKSDIPVHDSWQQEKNHLTESTAIFGMDLPVSEESEEDELYLEGKIVSKVAFEEHITSNFPAQSLNNNLTQPEIAAVNQNDNQQIMESAMHDNTAEIGLILESPPEPLFFSPPDGVTPTDTEGENVGINSGENSVRYLRKKKTSKVLASIAAVFVILILLGELLRNTSSTDFAGPYLYNPHLSEAVFPFPLSHINIAGTLTDISSGQQYAVNGYIDNKNERIITMTNSTASFLLITAFGHNFVKANRAWWDQHNSKLTPPADQWSIMTKENSYPLAALTAVNLRREIDACVRNDPDNHRLTAMSEFDCKNSKLQFPDTLDSFSLIREDHTTNRAFTLSLSNANPIDQIMAYKNLSNQLLTVQQVNLVSSVLNPHNDYQCTDDHCDITSDIIVNNVANFSRPFPMEITGQLHNGTNTHDGTNAPLKECIMPITPVWGVSQSVHCAIKGLSRKPTNPHMNYILSAKFDLQQQTAIWAQMLLSNGR